MAKELRFNYARYRAVRLRPRGHGAFHDFALAAGLAAKPSRRTRPPKKGNAMQWERIEANWQHYKVLARVRWARLTEEELDGVAGRREALAAAIHHTYGVSADMAQMQLESWQGQQQEPPGTPEHGA
jgi:uncharacterized protein YjbJ (UPF0337 family)